jgi:hypothetical protein
MTNERSPHRQPESPFEVDAIAHALGAPAEQVAEGTHEIVLRNEPLRLTLRLGLVQDQRQVSIYLRGPTAFLGMLVLWNVTKVEPKADEGKVDFVAKRGRSQLRLSVLSTGNFLMGNEPEAPAGRST